MSLTLITNEVIQASSIGPDNLSFGAPSWDTSGTLYATKFIGDGSGLTNVFPGLSVVEVTDTFFQITPDHNNAVLALNNSSDILLDLDFIGTFVEGHKTTLVQVNQGKGIIGFPTYNSSGYDRTQGIYSVGTLLYGGFSNGWTLYGDLTAQVLPDTSGNDGRATQLATGWDSSFALAGNSLYSVGSNNYSGNQYGQLGTGDALDRSTFTRLSGSWTSVFGTRQIHTFALSGTDLYAVGRNQFGQFGLGDVIHRSTFTKLPGNWTGVAGNDQTYALSGTDLYTVGANTFGQLGLGDTIHRSTFVKIAGSWSSVSCGGGYSLALSGTDLYVTGYNGQGRLGLGDVVDRSTFTKVTIPGNARWTAIAAGRQGMTFALSGTDLYAVGEGGYGALGLGDTTDRSTFTKVPGSWTKIFEAGSNHSFVLSGTDLYVAGYTQYGGLGLGDPISRSTFTKIDGNWSQIVSIGSQHSLALSATGNQLFSTGSNSSGQLGLGDTASRSTFTRVSGVYIEYSAPALPQFTQVAAGYDHSLALSGTDLYGTGSNTFGALSLNINGASARRSTFTKISIPFNAKWTAIAAGYDFSLALSGADLYSVGSTGNGELGLGDQISRSTFTKVTVPSDAKWTAIAAGWAHSLALSGTDLYTTGSNYNGQLGLGNTLHRSTFTKVIVPTNAKWTAASPGQFHILALSGTDLYATGNNTSGKLGLGDILDRSTFTKINGKWNSVVCGEEHSCALSGTDLYVCGNGASGALGLVDANPRSTFTKVTFPADAKWTAVAAARDYSLALSGTDLYVTGYNNLGQLGLGDTTYRYTFTKIPGNWTAISAGYYHSLALSGTALHGTGRNTTGALGLNDNTNRTTFTQITAVGQ